MTRNLPLLGLLLIRLLAGCCVSTIAGISTSGTGTTSGSDGPPACPPATDVVAPGPLTPRNNPGAAFGADGLAYIAGGSPYGGGPTALVEVLNPDSGTVTVGPPMLTARGGFALVASLDRQTLYAIGGEYPGATPRAESFDIATQTWTPTPLLPIPEGGALAGVLGDGRVVAIFPDATGSGASVEVFADGGWLPGPDLDPVVSPAEIPWLAPAYGAAGVADAIFAVDAQLTVEAWSSSLDAGWNQVAQARSVGRRRLNFSLAQSVPLIFVSGGLGAGVDCTNTEGGLLALDTTNLDAGWSELASPPTYRDSAAAAISPDSRIYVFGGESISSCCRRSLEVRSLTTFGSYDVFDLDAGVWEPTHDR